MVFVALYFGMKGEAVYVGSTERLSELEVDLILKKHNYNRPLIVIKEYNSNDLSRAIEKIKNGAQLNYDVKTGFFIGRVSEVIKILDDLFSDCQEETEEEYVERWWNSCDEQWRKIFKASYFKVRRVEAKSIPDDRVTIEDKKAMIKTIKKVKLFADGDVENIIPLVPFQLQELHCGNSNVIDLFPIMGSKNLEVLNICDTDITDISVVRAFKNLKRIYAVETNLKSIKPLFQVKKLEVLWLDFKNIPSLQKELNVYKQINPTCKVNHKDEGRGW